MLPLVVYGNGDMFRELFNAIAAAFNDSHFGVLLKLMMGLSGTWAIFRYSVERSMRPVLRWLGTYYIALYVCFFPKASIEIIDRVNAGHAYAVDHVPLGLAVIASYTSTIGDALTQWTEKNFSLPDDLMYQKTGLAMASRLVLASTQFQVTDPNFQQSLQSFVQQCVFYDLLLNKYSWNDLINATNLWQFVSQYASPARAFVYYQPGTSQIMTCQQGLTALNKDWTNAIQEAASRYGSRLLAVEANQAKNQLLSYLPNAYSFLTHTADSAASIMQQNMMANALQNGILHLGATTNAPAVLEAYAFTKAQQQKRLTNYTLGDMAAYWLPIMKNVLEASMYGAFMIVFLLFLFPFGQAIGKNYVMSLMWIQLWAPLYAILNLFINFYAKRHSLGALTLDTGHLGLTLSTQAGLAQVNADVAGLAGYLSLSIPLLAAGIVNGMMSVFTQAAQYIAGVTQSAAAGAAGEAIAGNLSLGNTNLSNHSSFNTSANHFDTDTRVSSGAYTYQTAGGSTLSIMPDGSTVMNNQGALSSLGTTVNLAYAIRSLASEQADTSYAAALSHTHAYSDSVSSGIRSLYELSAHASTNESSGDSSSVTVSGGASTALSEFKQMTDRFAHDHNVSSETALRVLGAAYISAKIGSPGSGISAFSVEGGGRAELDASASSQDRLLYSSAQEYIQNTQFSQTMDHAIRGVQEHSYRTQNETGQRLVDNVGSSFDRAEQARHDMMSNYQQAQTYRKAASVAEENAASINSSANQQFFEYLQNKTGYASEIEKMMVHHPEKAQAYAKQFIQDKAQSALQAFRQAEDSTPQKILNTYENNNASIPKDAAISEQHNMQKADIENKAKTKALDNPSLVSRQAVVDTDTLIKSGKSNTAMNKEKLDEKSDALKENTQNKLHSNMVGRVLKKIFLNEE